MQGVTHIPKIQKLFGESPVLAHARAAVRQHIVLTLIFSAAINLLYLAPSLFMLQVYDRVLVTGGLTTLVFLCLALVIALVSLSGLDAVRSRLLVRLGLRFDRVLAAKVLDSGLDADVAASSSNRPFQGLRDLETLRQGLSSLAMIALLDAPWAPLYILVCFLLSPWLGMLVLAGSVLLFVLARLNERVSRQSLETLAKDAPALFASQEADARLAGTARALGMRKALIARRLKERDNLLNGQAATANLSARYASITKFTRLILQSASLALGAVLAVRQDISPGAIIAVTILTSRAYAPIEQIVGGWRQLSQCWLAYRNINEALAHSACEIARTPLPPPRGEIRVENVGVLKPGTNSPALIGIDLAAQPGEMVGIVGPTGAGKSTLARILAGAIMPQVGMVWVDGVRYADWEPETLAQYVGFLPQDIGLFSGTVAENIARFQGDVVQDRELIGRDVIEAAKAASAHEMILKLPEAYETRLGLGGVGLSAGQSQRIALARALFRSPKILVLDEPNSHLDSEGESALVAALKFAKNRGAVVFVVAHRAGIMSIADKLLVVRDARIDAFGARDQIAAKLALASGVQPVAQPAPQKISSN